MPGKRQHRLPDAEIGGAIVSWRFLAKQLLESDEPVRARLHLA
jgi:hypothetical protein